MVRLHVPQPTHSGRGPANRTTWRGGDDPGLGLVGIAPTCPRDEMGWDGGMSEMDGWGKGCGASCLVMSWMLCEELEILGTGALASGTYLGE